MPRVPPAEALRKCRVVPRGPAVVRLDVPARGVGGARDGLALGQQAARRLQARLPGLPEPAPLVDVGRERALEPREGAHAARREEGAAQARVEQRVRGEAEGRRGRERDGGARGGARRWRRRAEGGGRQGRRLDGRERVHGRGLGAGAQVLALVQEDGAVLRVDVGGAGGGRRAVAAVAAAAAADRSPLGRERGRGQAVRRERLRRVEARAGGHGDLVRHGDARERDEGGLDGVDSVWFVLLLLLLFWRRGAGGVVRGGISARRWGGAEMRASPIPPSTLQGGPMVFSVLPDRPRPWLHVELQGLP